MGRLAEERAAALLESHGATILLRNFRARCGELDLVALHAGAVLVVEVRRRQRHEWGGAAASVDARKRQRIVRTTRRLLQCHPELNRRPLRFDVIACDGETGNDLRWIRHAFDASER
ncbi:MAG: YraN family protein [Gammaproteobacteria bacterium]|nr:YraN family protein [Gammaproteobacteria bacterium]